MFVAVAPFGVSSMGSACWVNASAGPSAPPRFSNEHDKVNKQTMKIATILFYRDGFNLFRFVLSLKI